FMPPSFGVYPPTDPQYPADQLQGNSFTNPTRGIEDTIFRSQRGRNTPILTDTRIITNLPSNKEYPAGQPHPYLRQSLLNKIYQHISYRSNVFAVWVTVGFFEVDDLGRLGKEIGRNEGRHVRHRMFSIVDRSALAKTYNGDGGRSSSLQRGI